MSQNQFRPLLLSVILLAIPRVTAAQLELQQRLFETLIDQLHRVRVLVEATAVDTGLAAADLRQRLRELLDQLEAQHESRSPAWVQLTAPGGSRVSAKEVDKLIKELSKRADKILEKKGDYSLSDLLTDAAKRANVPDYRARGILLWALGVDPDTAAVFTGLPERVSLQLRVRSSSLGGADVVKILPRDGGVDLPPGGVGAGTVLGRELMTAPMEYYLKREMEKSDYVKWVVVGPNPRAAPECGLYLDILTFATSWRQTAAATEERPAQFVLNVGMQLKVELYHYRLKNVVYSEFKEYNYDFPREMDDETRPGLQFDKYYERVVRDVRASLETFLGD